VADRDAIEDKKPKAKLAKHLARQTLGLKKI
jgi:hypothetical protein